MKQFKIRSSSTGHIMGNMGLTENQLITLRTLQKKEKPTEKQLILLGDLTYKNDNPELPKTAKTYCEHWVKQEFYNRTKVFTSKQIEKGLDVEDESIDYIAKHLDFGMLIKNRDYFGDSFITGTPDILLKGLVIDVKNSFDAFTFPLFDKEVPNKDYYWQLQSYMALTDRNNAKLIYTLMDTPYDIIEREYSFNNKDGLNWEEFKLNYEYNNIESKYRIKVFDIERNDADIAKIYERVEECRTYIKSLI